MKYSKLKYSKLLLIVLVLAVACIGCQKVAEAGEPKDVCDTFLGALMNKCSPDTQTTAKEATDLELGVKIDVPNVIVVAKDVSVGFEGGKDLFQTDRNQGWFAYAKVTIKGSLLDFTKE